jgi:hypothetical protein
MDIVSDVASVWALVQLAGSVIEYIKGAIGAPEERARVANEIQATATVLNSLSANPISPQWKAILEAPNGSLELFKMRSETRRVKITSCWEMEIQS